MKKQRSFAIEPLETRELLAASTILPSINAVRPDPSSLIRSAYSIDGTGNNLANPEWGSTNEQLLRMAAAAYADGLSNPAGSDRPSAREISSLLVDQGGEDVISDRFLSAMIYAWGQFIDHDLDLTPNAKPGESFNVIVPANDPAFTRDITLNRSVYDPNTGFIDPVTGEAIPRQQLNIITAWLDGSMIYGSDAATAKALRTLQGGLLKTSPGDLLPFNNTDFLPDGALPMDNDAHIVPNSQLFAAGDVRANENIELTSMHTLFVREHNYWARVIAARNRGLSDEQIYQQARAIVIAELQAITYNQWLPSLLGPGAIDRYAGYNSNVNPGIANEFSTAAFRVGHTLLGDDVEFFDNNGLPVAEEVPLSGAFFNPTLVSELGIDSVLKYLASDPASEVDNTIVDSVRNFLFGPPDAGGLDLASLNIQRGRDHGLADYYSVREAYGLDRVTSFDQITTDTEVQAKLQQLYGSVDNIDLWVGALAEDHVRGGSVGQTLRAIISDQFERLRDGDRFWYQRTFSGPQLQQIESTKLTDILRRNTDLTNLQQNVFFFRASISGTVFADANRDGRMDRFERALAGITVQLVNLEENEVVAETSSDARGNYRFNVADGLRTGEYQIRLILPDGMVQTSRSDRTIAVTRGGQSFDVNLGIAPLRLGGLPRAGALPAFDGFAGTSGKT